MELYTLILYSFLGRVMGLTEKEVRPMSDRYTHTQHAVGGSTWHFEWCTKYRYKLFRKEYLKNLCLIALNEAAKRHGIEILEMDVQPNHLHMLAHIPLRLNPLKALQYLKGFSSRLLFEIKPKLRLLYPKGYLWSRGKFAASVGDVDINYVVDYVRNQKAHHAKAFSLMESSPRSEAEGLPEGQGFSPRRRSNGIDSEIYIRSRMIPAYEKKISLCRFDSYCINCIRFIPEFM